jgi:hypothetical protein
MRSNYDYVGAQNGFQGEGKSGLVEKSPHQERCSVGCSSLIKAYKVQEWNQHNQADTFGKTLENHQREVDPSFFAGIPEYGA